MFKKKIKIKNDHENSQDIKSNWKLMKIWSLLEWNKTFKTLTKLKSMLIFFKISYVISKIMFEDVKSYLKSLLDLHNKA